MTGNPNNPNRWWDALAGMILMAALLTAASRLVATSWTRDLSIVQTLTFFGIVAGFALGQSRFSPFIAVSFAIAYGIVAAPWQLGSLLREDLLWPERLMILTNRLGIIIYQILHREVLSDSLLFLVIMASLFWALSVHAGYAMVRHGRSWGAVLPTGLGLFVIHAFDPLIFRRGLYLAVYFIFALVFVSRMIFLQYRNQWQTNRTALPPQLGFNFFRFTMMAVVLIVLFAWTIPGLANVAPAAQQAWKPVLQLWDKTRHEIENLFAPLRSSAAAVSNIYGESASLGRGNPLTDAQVFSVEVPGDIPPGVRLYWRARVYDNYDNGQWVSSIGGANSFDPQRTDLRSPIYSGRWLGSFDFIASTSISTLFSPSLPLWVNRPGQVEYIEIPDGSADISTFRPDPPLETGQGYKAQSAVNYATESQLRSAGSDYPTWITDRFLQLPDSITPRTFQLAEQITANEPTVYDKVVAVTNFLRENIEYTDTIEADLPLGSEVVDWFIFEYRRGFCNYYSTAEIVLLRAAGIPARWAIGYAQGDQLEGDRTGGEPSQERITYLVRQRDAHAWPEVYFPGIGWVEFEPTTSQPDIARVPGDSNETKLDPGLNRVDPQSQRDMERNLAELLDERDLIPGNLERGHTQSYMVYWLVLFLLAGTGLCYWSWRAGWLYIAWQGGIIYIQWRERYPFVIQPVSIMLENSFKKFGIRPPQAVQLWSKRALLPPVSKAYLQINLALDRLGAKPSPNETPAERAARLGELVPEAERAAQRLVREYQVATFSQKPANLVIAWNAATEIRNLIRKDFFQRLRSRK